jgi:hypothetical protein
MKRDKDGYPIYDEPYHLVLYRGEVLAEAQTIKEWWIRHGAQIPDLLDIEEEILPNEDDI